MTNRQKLKEVLETTFGISINDTEFEKTNSCLLNHVVFGDAEYAHCGSRGCDECKAFWEREYKRAGDGQKKHEGKRYG